ncbi:hypothetical protein EJB05_26449 [Eragrostis curvula]|uniref:Replication factor A C-terminal domain-containing protein n=1 Tax=Eragrostis curvula TaxID=38414 RepID=A0A5J9UKW1_9POAL|nr:hypothetical protein EJB05_26449 [Eragrostis curvula]
MSCHCIDGMALSGNSAWRWYINPAVPEVPPLLKRYEKTSDPVERVPVANAAPVADHDPVEPEEITISEMRKLIPYEFPVQICYFVIDGTAETEVIFFGDVGRRLIGKEVRMLMGTRRKDDSIPAEIAAQVGQKFQLTINVTERAFMGKPYSYDVKRTDHSFGRQLEIPRLHTMAGTSSSQNKKPAIKDTLASATVKETQDQSTMTLTSATVKETQGQSTKPDEASFSVTSDANKTTNELGAPALAPSPAATPDGSAGKSLEEDKNCPKPRPTRRRLFKDTTTADVVCLALVIRMPQTCKYARMEAL